MIFIVDDEMDIRELIRYVLQTNNIDSLDFSNPCEFLDTLNNLNSENMPEIILLDVGLPQKNGIETLKILKQRQTTKHIPVILLTAKNSEISLRRWRYIDFITRNNNKSGNV